MDTKERPLLQTKPTLNHMNYPRDKEAICEDCGQGPGQGKPFYGLRTGANLAQGDEPELYLCHTHYKKWVDDINQLITKGELDYDYWRDWEAIVYDEQ
jgi:hypothetical protein